MNEAEVHIKKRMTITEMAKILGISPKTIIRWEKTGKIKKSKRDWRRWRVYDEDDFLQIKNFLETVFEAE